MFARSAVIAGALLVSGCVSNNPSASGPVPPTTISDFAAQCEAWDEWDKPAPPFHIYGSTFYVGTCGISAILITGPDGHILLDSGTDAGAQVVLDNIATLGFDPDDVTYLLHSHEHFDHTGGHARIVEASGAAVIASRKSAEVLRTGISHRQDPQFGMHDAMAPVAVAREVSSGDRIETAAATLIAHETPGHSPGALSWSWEECAPNDGCKVIVYADSLSPVSADSYRFSANPNYLAAYREGLERLAALECDILLTPHPSHSKMVERAGTGSFTGGVTCADYAAGKTRDLDARLGKEAARQ